MNPNSVKDRLKIHAKKYGHVFQDDLTIYGLERTIYRLSISKYVDNFVLKGGIFLYALYNGEFSRITSDIDLLSNTSNDVDNLRKIMTEVFAIHANDGLTYDLESIHVKLITECKEYHGIKVSVKAYLECTLINISIDIGFGDIIYPNKVEMEFPVLLNMEVPHIFAYSLESVIAEKFEAFVQLGYGNSRYKDFYDIYMLASTYDFDGQILKQAIHDTFQHRKTVLLDVVAFDDDFTSDSTRQLRWISFIKKKKAMEYVEFQILMNTIVSFLSPIREAILAEVSFHFFWNHEKKYWM